MNSAHNYKKPESDEDPLTLMLTKTGCIDLHYKVQECIADSQDWRKCQEDVKRFKDCMQSYTNKQREKYANN
ncbi:unnamed protein product [Diamesa hyperborea]